MQKFVNHVDLVKSFQTCIYLQKSVSIQPRKGLSKFDKHQPEVRKKVRLLSNHRTPSIASRRSSARCARTRSSTARRSSAFRECCSFSAVSAPIFATKYAFCSIFKIYQIFKLKFLKFGNILQIVRHLRNFC